MPKIKLKRELGLGAVTLTGIGIILGAGIYALIGKAAAIAGTGVWISFLIAAGIAALTGLSYAELSSMFPKAGAEYVYTNKAFGKRMAFLIGWLVSIGGVIGAAAVSLGFGGYLFGLTGIPLLYGAGGLILAVSLILFYGIRETANAAIIGTLIEAGGLILIIIFALPYLGSINYFEVEDFGGVLSGAALVFFAYLGFEEMSRMAEETKKPHETMPKAIVLAILITSLLYAVVAVSAISVLSPEVLGASESPLADVAAKAFGAETGIILAVIALFATANTVLMMQCATSRILYGIGEGNPSIPLISKVHKEKKTPWFAIIIVTLAAMVFLLFGGIEKIAYLTDFTIFMAFVIVNLSLIWLRHKKPKMKRKFKVPSIALPVLGAVSSFAMLFTMPFEIILYGLGLLAVGLVGYKVSK
ncbi:amino acid permease [Candidatus Micrarchaeota archaeon]|nr:amino acid permease [Candidatus Micrarchaeota archaeon]